MAARIALSQPKREALATSKPRTARNGEHVLHPVRPNARIEAAYRARLDALIDEMHRSLIYWIGAAYRANPPELAQDASPAADLRAVLALLSRRWRKRFAETSEELARYFAQNVAERSSADLDSILRRGGISVRFRMTRAMQDVLTATVNENVSLIKSIAQQHLTAVEGHVMRSVQAGRKLDELAHELQHQFGVTKRRAALIARSQNNLMTADFTRVRQQEAGITEAVWLHSGGGRDPRPSHVKAGQERQKYDVRSGWFDPHEKKNIWPGQLINCRCVSRSVVRGFS